MSMAMLLVAICAINVATLLLLRSAGRAREMAMRYALGACVPASFRSCWSRALCSASPELSPASRLRPVVASALARLLITSDPTSAQPYSTSIDTRILLFTLVVSVVTSLVFSVAPYSTSCGLMSLWPSGKIRYRRQNLAALP